MNRGEVWWVEHPVLGRRPFLVLTRPEVIGVLAKPLCAGITTRVRGVPTEVTLDKSDGMSKECVVTLEHIEPVSKRYFADQITQLSPERMARVCRALAVATGCEFGGSSQ